MSYIKNEDIDWNWNNNTLTLIHRPTGFSVSELLNIGNKKITKSEVIVEKRNLFDQLMDDLEAKVNG